MLRPEQELFSAPCVCVALCRKAHKHFCNDQITTINEQDSNSGSLLSAQMLCHLKMLLGKCEGSKTLANSKMFVTAAKKVRARKKMKLYNLGVLSLWKSCVRPSEAAVRFTSKLQLFPGMLNPTHCNQVCKC